MKIVRIVSKTVKGSLLPRRVIAYRKKGSSIIAGDKFLLPALVTLFALITGERLTSRDIKKIIKKKRIRVSREIWGVLD